MYNSNQFLGGCLSTIAFFILMSIASTLVGAFIGWIVGWFFSQPILNFFAAIGIEGFSMTELGAILGFIGGFFRGNVNNYNIADNNPEKKQDKDKDQEKDQ